MLMVAKHDLDPKMNHMGLKRGDKVEIEIADVTPMGFTLDPRTIKLNEMRDPDEVREPLTKQPKAKSAASMPLPDLKSMIQPPMSAPAQPPMLPLK